MRVSRCRVLRIQILGSCGVFKLTLRQVYPGKKLVYMDLGGPQSRRGMWRRKYFLLQGIEPGFLVHPLKPVHTDCRK